MLLRLPPIPVRLFGHAVHRAPDTQSNQHPGYGAAGHSGHNEAVGSCRTWSQVLPVQVYFKILFLT